MTHVPMRRPRVAYARRGRVAAAVLVTALAATGGASADFSGMFDPSKWTFVAQGGGSGTITAAKLHITGGNEGVAGKAEWSVTTTADVIVKFDFSFTAFDTSGFDKGYCKVGGVTKIILSGTSSWVVGPFQIPAGTEVVFGVSTVDGIFGPGLLNVTNFTHFTEFDPLGLTAIPPVDLPAPCPEYESRPGKPLPDLDGEIFAATVWDPDGAGPQPARLVVGGQFASASQKAVSNVAVWDGQTWAALGTGTDGPVRALIAYGGALIAAGDFTKAGGVPAARIAAWDGSRWSPLGAGLNNAVHALVVFGGELVVGGAFTSAGETPSNRIAAWDGASWKPLGSGANGIVRTLSEFDDRLIAGGSFTSIDGIAANRIAAWDGVGWHPLGSGLELTSPIGDAAPYALVVYDGKLVAGGVFTVAGGLPASRIAQWDGVAWAPLGGGVGGVTSPSPIVRALAVHDGRLFAGGFFKTAGGAAADHIAAWDGSAWSDVKGGVGSGTATATVRALSTFQDHVVAAGLFDSAGEVAVRNVARWNGAAWKPIDTGFNGTISAADVFKGRLVVGGSFTAADGEVLSHAAQWDGSAWKPVGTSLNAQVLAIAEYGGSLIAGGDFESAGATPLNHIARLEGNQWKPLGQGLNGRVRALAVYQGELIVGGEFTMAGAVPAQALARWDGSSWHPLGGGVSSAGPLYPYVTALRVYGGDLFVGGSFDHAGGVPASHVARWDGATWKVIDGFDGRVNALRAFKGQLYAAGNFSQVIGSQKFLSGIARFDAGGWVQLPGNPNLYSTNALLALEGQLLVGGGFTKLDGAPGDRIAAWDGSQWTALPGVNNGAVFALAVHDGDVYAGGSFTMVDGQPSAHLARWACAPCPGDVDGNDFVNQLDLALLLADWGCAAPPGACPGDLDKDGVTGQSDLAIVLAHYGAACR